MPPLATHSVLPSGSSSLVRPDAAAIEFADAPVGAAARRRRCRAHRVRHRSHFRWRPASAVVEERAMAEEMPVLRQVSSTGPAAHPGEAQREEARLAAEDHGAPAGRVNGEAVATRRHRHDAQVAARFVQQRGLVARRLRARSGSGPRRSRAASAALSASAARAATGIWPSPARPPAPGSGDGQSPSSALKPMVTPSAGARSWSTTALAFFNQPGQRPLAARLAVAGHVLVGRRRVAQGLRGARQSPRTASSIQLPPCGSG